MTARITNAALSATVATLTEAVAKIAEQQAVILGMLAQASTPTLVAETVASKVTPIAATAKIAKARKATAKMVTLTAAQKRVDAGESPWKIMVKSSTTGEAIPFAKVSRALKAAERKANGETVKDATTAKAVKVDNKALAAEMRALGLKPNGGAWAAYKAGERDLNTLKALV